MTWLDTPEGEAAFRRAYNAVFDAGPTPAVNNPALILRALTEDAPCDTCGGEGWVVPDGERAIALCPAGCDGGIRRAPLVPRGAATIDSLHDAFTRGIAAGVGQERAAVSGALADTGNLPGDLSPSEAIRRLTEERDRLRTERDEARCEAIRLTEERDDAMKERNRALVERDKARAEVADLRAEKNEQLRELVRTVRDLLHRDEPQLALSEIRRARALLSTQKDDDR